MNPNDTNNNLAGKPSQVANIPNGQPNEPAHKEAAINILRSQIDSIYDNPNVVAKNQETTSQTVILEDINPYERTHQKQTGTGPDSWSKYHTAWQDYYQKYYERYYMHYLKKAHDNMIDNNSKDANTLKEEALFDLRQRLLRKVRDTARTVKKSRHFWPIISGVIVVLIFAFLQYNRFIVSNAMAYVSPGSIDPQNIITDPSTDVAVNAEPRLIIPKINVDVPVLYDVGNDNTSQMTAMTKGVAQFAIPGASSHPGEVGNTVIAGHSSNDLLDTGDYKFIFVQLEKLVEGDTIYLNYNSKRYTYTVTKKEVVKPTDVSKLTNATTKPILTLITCTPIGTSTNRLLVTAEQVSPDPSTAIAASSSTSSETTKIPGNSPTLLERLFGSND